METAILAYPAYPLGFWYAAQPDTLWAMKESSLYTPIILKATQLGSRLFRNNVGALKNERGQWVRYGVANPGGSDMIGIAPCVVTESMVGLTVGILLAVEVKPDRGSKASAPQRAFLEFVKKMGGIAFKAHSTEEFEAQLNKYRDELTAGKNGTNDE